MIQPKILIIDYGMGNLASVRRTFEKCGVNNVVISDDIKEIEHCDKVVLPGVGAFSNAMDRLVKTGWKKTLKSACGENKKPLLGICLGMQLLADTGDENEKGTAVEGMGLVPGQVKRLEAIELHEKIPHVGWNEVAFSNSSSLFEDIKSNSDFYFVHSYHMVPEKEETIIGYTPYCGQFVSAIEQDNVFGVQFHPEKSSRSGIQLIKNFIRI